MKFFHHAKHIKLLQFSFSHFLAHATALKLYDEEEEVEENRDEDKKQARESR